MENTLKNKSRFFAQYWGQNVWCNKHYKNLEICTESFFQDHINSKAYIELKPLSSINDEEKIYIIKWIIYTHVKFENPSPLSLWEDNWLKNISLETGDYLRSKGYALPFNGLSVENQIEFDWIKLKNQ